MKFSFLPFHKVYSVVRVSREKGDLRLYFFYAGNSESKERMLIDAQVMKAAHDNLPTKSTLTVNRLLSIPSLSTMGKVCLDQSLNRIIEVHYLDLPRSLKFLLWSVGISVGAKRFQVERSLLAKFDS